MTGNQLTYSLKTSLGMFVEVDTTIVSALNRSHVWRTHRRCFFFSAVHPRRLGAVSAPYTAIQCLGITPSMAMTCSNHAKTATKRPQPFYAQYILLLQKRAQIAKLVVPNNLKTVQRADPPVSGARSETKRSHGKTSTHQKDDKRCSKNSDR